MSFDPSAYFPSGYTEDSVYSEEVWDLACEKFDTDTPTGEQLYEADQELQEAWEDWGDL